MSGGFKGGSWNAKQRAVPMYLPSVGTIRRELLTEAYKAALVGEPELTPEQFAEDVLSGKREV